MERLIRVTFIGIAVVMLSGCLPILIGAAIVDHNKTKEVEREIEEVRYQQMLLRSKQDE